MLSAAARLRIKQILLIGNRATHPAGDTASWERLQLRAPGEHPLYNGSCGQAGVAFCPFSHPREQEPVRTHVPALPLGVA